MRFWEVDFFRGIAIILMIIFNYAFALSFFKIYTFGGGDAFWLIFPRVVASIFVFVAGISLYVSYSKRKSAKKVVSRGIELLILGFVITAATYYFIPGFMILFGILHLIGASIILSLPFLKKNYFSWLLGLLIIAIGLELSISPAEFSALFWLVPNFFFTLDYFPVFPWFGVFIFGLFFAGKFYSKGKRRFRIRQEPSYSKPVSFLGRHSLIIYMAHIPLLIVFLYLAGFAVF